MTIPSPLRVHGFPADVATQVLDTVDHVGEEHPDTVGLLAVLDRGTPLAAARVVEVTPEHLRIEGTDGTATIGWPGGDLAADDVAARLLGVLASARAAVAEGHPPTSLERERARTASLPTFVTEVRAVGDVGPGMRRIVLGGGLDAFRPVEADQFVYLVTDGPGGTPLPDDFAVADLGDLDPGERPPAAYYTVRTGRPARGELELWLVRHDHPGTVAAWAETVRPGHRVALWGPRGSFRPPPGTRRLLLVADPTALAAVAAILEARRCPATVVVEARRREVIDLPTGSDVHVEWIVADAHRDPSTALVAVLDTLDVDADGLYAFGAGEAALMRRVRHHLRVRFGLAREQVRVSAYWRR